MISMWIIILIVLWGGFWLSFSIDRSRYRNVILLGFALMATPSAICIIFRADRVLVFFFVIVCLALLLLPFLLVANGILMIRREGHKLANLLSLLLGLVIGIGEIATYVAIYSETLRGIPFIDAISPRLSGIITVISITVIYLSASVVFFVVYSILLLLIPRRKDFDYVIIHGAGLIDGSKVSKLLSDRIDKAIEIYRKDPTPPIMIPSGGKGPDEDIPEAEAMTAYLKEHGIPEEKIIPEDRSTTTFENLENSKTIIEAREGKKYTTLVTSNYHVYRALRYCRKIGLKCTGVGSHVALYYWPSAVIREWAAVHAEKKHAVILAAGWILCLLFAFLL